VIHRALRDAATSPPPITALRIIEAETPPSDDVFSNLETLRTRPLDLLDARVTRNSVFLRQAG
jgi:hypothetical protein